MADTYSYISTTYGTGLDGAAANTVTISNSTAATNPDIEIRMAVAGFASGGVPSDAELKQAILLAIEVMEMELINRTISSAGINLLTS